MIPDHLYKKIKAFILKLPRDKWIMINSIPNLDGKARQIFIDGCKQMIDNQDYDKAPVYLSFSNDYTQVRLFTDHLAYVKQLKSNKWG